MRKFSLAVTLVCLLSCLALGVSAQASTPSANAHTYGVVHTYLERLDRVSSSQVKASLSRTEARLAPCFTHLFGAYYQATEATGVAPSQGTLKSLSEELGVEAVFKGASPLVSAELDVRPFLTLHLPSAYDKAFKFLLSLRSTIHGIDFCADAKAWEKSKLATSWALPAGSERTLLQLSGAANKKLSTTGNLDRVPGVTGSQAHALHILGVAANKHSKQLLKLVALRFEEWVVAEVKKVQSQYPTTTTTTTTPTSTTTTPTTTATTPTTTTTQ